MKLYFLFLRGCLDRVTLIDRKFSRSPLLECKGIAEGLICASPWHQIVLSSA